MTHKRICEFIDFCDMVKDNLDDWEKLDEKNKQCALEKYASLKMKIIEGINGLSDGKEKTEYQDAENDQDSEDENE